MNKKVKSTLKNIGIGIGIFLGVAFVAFTILFLGINILHEKNIISEIASIIIILAGAFVAAIASLIVYFIRRRKNKYKIFSSVGSKITFFFFLFQGFVNAFKSEIILDANSAQKIVELEWMIFSIAITLFVVWHTIVSNILSKKFKSGVGLKRIENIQNKQQLYKDSTNFVYNLILLFLALICLTYTTPMVFVGDDMGLFTQFLVIFNITIVINAIMVVFYDIFTPLLADLIFVSLDKMSDKDAVDEMLLAIAEEVVKDTDNEGKLTDEQVTSISKELLLKIKNGDFKTENNNKEKINESNT